METLIKIQGELKAPKNQFNNFGKYKYRSCEDILEAVKPLCVKYGALLTVSDKVTLIGSYAFVEATATFKHADFSHEVTASARHTETKKGMDDSQITGTASSYARKYALNGLFCIDDTKDADTQKPPVQTKKDPVEESIRIAFGNCKTMADVQKIWTNNKVLQTKDFFVKLKDARKKILNDNGITE